MALFCIVSCTWLLNLTQTDLGHIKLACTKFLTCALSSHWYDEHQTTNDKIWLQKFLLRDGPLEKLWGGRGIFEPQEFFFFNVSREWIFFFGQDVVHEYFFPWSNTKLKKY